jgi:hypothetical protein
LADDRLGYADFARSVARSIADLASTEGIVLAVNGPWGSGKTTAVNMIVDALGELSNTSEASRKVVPIHFNPWWFSGQEDLTKAFFAEVSANLSKRVSKKGRGRIPQSCASRRLLQRIDSALNRLALIALAIGLVESASDRGVDSMRAQDFSAWLSAIAGLSAEQRREAVQALKKADGAETGCASEDLTGVSPKRGGERGRREDALGGASHERVESQGCPHCAGRETIGWGRSHGLLRFRCKSCGRTFNALTKTSMAHLRKKERWLDHARAMIEGKGRILESFKGRWSDLPRRARKRGGTARHPGLYQDNVPVLVARDRKGATFDAVLPQVDSASVGSALAGVVTAGNHLGAIIWSATEVGRSPLSPAGPGFPSTAHAVAGKTDRRGASPAHQQRQRLSPPPQAMAGPLQRRRHQEPAELSRMAARPRSLGRPTGSTKLDQRRYRKRTLPTVNAIRAIMQSFAPREKRHPVETARRHLS